MSTFTPAARVAPRTLVECTLLSHVGMHGQTTACTGAERITTSTDSVGMLSTMTDTALAAFADSGRNYWERRDARVILAYRAAGVWRQAR